MLTIQSFEYGGHTLVQFPNRILIHQGVGTTPPCGALLAIETTLAAAMKYVDESNWTILTATRPLTNRTY